MKELFFTLALLTAAGPVFAESPTKADKPEVASAEPIVGTWKHELKGEDGVYIFKADGTAKRYRGNWHEDGKWKKLSGEVTQSYQCVFNGGAAIFKASYEASPEHISLRSSDNNKKLGTLKRLQVK